MIGSDSICNILHEYRLTGLWLCHDECALSLSDWREEIYDSCTWIGSCRITAKFEFLFWEERCEMFKRHTVAHLRRVASVDEFDIAECEVFLTFAWWANSAIHYVACFQSVSLNLLW